LGLLAAIAVSFVASAATAADEPSSVDSARLSGGGQLHWRSSRPAQSSRPSEENRLGGVQTANHDEPIWQAPEAVHRDSHVVPAQRLVAAEPLVNPFADEPSDMKSKKADAKNDAKSSASPVPDASAAPTLPEPSSPTVPAKVPARDPAPARFPGSDPVAPDAPKSEPKNDRQGLPFPSPAAPGNEINSQINPVIPPATIPPATITPAPNPPSQEPNTTTGKVACDKERDALMKNTVNTVSLDIRPKLTGNDVLPGECTLGEAQFIPRTWDGLTYTWKASALCHKPLYFEEVALERYGHSRGPILDPLVSAAHFFVTVPLLPYEMGVEPPCECEYTLGYYRPGDCAPWIIDGFPISLRGMALECTAATGAAFAIP
jgi:hypothetical protein